MTGLLKINPNNTKYWKILYYSRTEPEQKRETYGTHNFFKRSESTEILEISFFCVCVSRPTQKRRCHDY